MLNKSLKKKLSIAYGILLAILGLFIYSGLNKEYVEVEEKESSSSSTKEKTLNVSLKVENGGTYELKMKNTETILDLLQEVRDEADFTYERVAYNYGVEIEQVNNSYPPKGEKWVIINGDDVLIYEIGDTYLEDKKTYELATTRIEEIQ